MKLIQAVIKPFKLDDVRKALSKVGVHGVTVGDAKGFGRQKGHTEIYRGAEYEIEMQPKLSVEVVVRNDQFEDVLEAISEAAHTGKIGDGKIFVSSVEHVVRIRTGEIDEAAI